MTANSVLIVEDDADLREYVAGLLQAAGFRTVEVGSVAEAVSTTSVRIPDLVLLDLTLPDGDGLQLFRELREKPVTQDVAIIVVSARNRDRDIVQALEMGAEDYVTKPFNANILLARVRRVLRRRDEATTTGSEKLRVGPISIDPDRHEARVEDAPVRLTAGEFRALRLFMGMPGHVFTRSQIIEHLRGPETYVSERSVDVLIAALRRKLHPHAHLLQTVHGVGYRFHPTMEELQHEG